MARPKKAINVTADVSTTDIENAAPAGVVHIKGPDGRTRYAWRKDGVRPVINLEDFARNIHSALDGTPGADFADHTGPQ